LIGDGDLMIEDMLIYSDKLQQPNTIELVISKDLEGIVYTFYELDAPF
jgi:hypothetical protein